MKKKIGAVIFVLSVMLTLLTACTEAIPSGMNKPAAAPTAQSEQNISQSEAAHTIKNMIRMDYTQYKINLIDGNFEYNGEPYFQFLISDKNAAIEPSIIVSKNNGAIFCYYPDSTVTEVYQDLIFKSKC